MQPLAGIRVLDFSTLLPGPLATLLLAEAGAEVIKIERPDAGDEMRSYSPKFGDDSVNFAMLNRGKRSIAIDLKQPDMLSKLEPLIRTADIIVEQFRPGVMDRLGLGYESLLRMNSRIIYCSITGYGQAGPRAMSAAHDLNYVADTGMLGLAVGPDGSPVPPAALVADIGGGTYPAVINILLALRDRERSGRGCKLDISMADNLFTFLYWAIGDGTAAQRWPRPGEELVTGGSPRYNIYRTKDDRFIAAAPLEDRFWSNFCSTIGLAPELRDDGRDPEATKRAVQSRIREKSAMEWCQLFAGKDICCNLVNSVQAALDDPHFRSRGLFKRELCANGRSIPALPVPLADQWRNPQAAGYPGLGEANGLLDEPDAKE
jgi:alpha-methylacyl-CoA racemase